MGYRKYILCLISSLIMMSAKAQVDSIRRVDSVSYALYQEANWKQLISYGNQSLSNQIDFPLLRLRLAYANFITGNFGAALNQYQKITDSDPANQTAIYYGYLCNKYLNRDAEASNYARYINKETHGPGNPGAFSLIDAGIESSFTFTQTDYRGNSSYTRAYLSNRLWWKLLLEQSVAYFNQPIYSAPMLRRRTSDLISANDVQSEYFIKLSYPLTKQLVVLGSYHYLSTNYQQSTYQNNVGTLGLKFGGDYYDLQADISEGNIISVHVAQYNGKVGVFPLGNLNLYAIGRVSYLQQTSAAVYDQTIGFKVVKNFWLEGSATFGKLDNYLAADGLYVYDAIDVTKFKAQSTAFVQLGAHTMLQLNYTFEKKTDDIQNIDYRQHSIALGLQWKF